MVGGPWRTLFLAQIDKCVIVLRTVEEIEVVIWHCVTVSSFQLSGYIVIDMSQTLLCGVQLSCKDEFLSNECAHLVNLGFFAILA